MNGFIRKSWIVLLILSFSPALMPQASGAADFARLTKLSGTVRVVREGVPQGVPAALEMPLKAGDQVLTQGKDSMADITFPNQDVVRIMSDSALRIKESDFKKKSFRIGLKLFAGKIFNVVRKFKRGSQYEVETRFATAGVRGTVWSAEVSGDPGNEEDVFMVKEGTVAAVSRAEPGKKGRGPTPEPRSKAVAPKETLVSDLKKTVVKPGKAPTEPVPLTPEEIAMFDILDDLIQQKVKDDIRDEIKDEIAEDILDSMKP